MSLNFDNFNSIAALFRSQVNLNGEKPYLWKKIEGNYVSLSWNDVFQQVNSIANGLLSLGILKGDRVVILSENRPEWQIADLAIMSIGAISVPAYAGPGDLNRLGSVISGTSRFHFSEPIS